MINNSQYRANHQRRKQRLFGRAISKDHMANSRRGLIVNIRSGAQLAPLNYHLSRLTTGSSTAQRIEIFAQFSVTIEKSMDKVLSGFVIGRLSDSSQDPGAA